MTDWERKIGAITLFVPDLDRAQGFYQDALGLETQAMGGDTVMVQFQDMFVFLRKGAKVQEPLPEVVQAARNGAGQFAIIVDDVDGVCSELAGRG